MASLPVRARLASRLAQQVQWRIAGSQPPNLSASRAARQHRIPPCSHSFFSTSSRLLLDQRAHPQPATASTTIQSQPSSSFQPDPPPRRRRIGVFSAAIFLILGFSIGTGIRAIVSPPPPILPGTKLDESLAADIRAAAAQLPLVKHLLSDPEWSGSHHEAYEGIPAESRPGRITTGPLRGTRGVGAYQHVFHNRSTGEVVSVVYLGPGTIGWPGVVHGGAIATLLDEHSARAALRDLERGGVLTANLDIVYKRPTLASDFYVLRARPVPEDELPAAERGKRGRKLWVDASIETVDGKTCVQCRSLFVSPKSMSLRRVPENF